MTGLLERIKSDLATHRLLKRNERVVVAVSGGVDSMVLLHALHALASDFEWLLSVAHFNHWLRGRSSDADERLVRETARRLKLPCDVAAADVRQAAAEQGGSVEMAARQLRHAFLANCARKRRARVIALAHHADDQVELFLLRLLRGAGGEGLGGMKPRSPSPASWSPAREGVRSAGNRISLVRPLLGFAKEEIADFAHARRLRFREDASNQSVEFERNWIRLKLLPLLRRRQSAVDKTILRAMTIAGAEADFVVQAAEAWLKEGPPKGGTPNEGFASLHVALQRRVLQLQVRAMGVEPDFQLIEQLRSEPNVPVSAGAKLDLICDAAGRVSIARPQALNFAASRRVVDLRADRPRPGRERTEDKHLKFGGLRLRWRVRRNMMKGFSLVRQEGREYFDADKVGARMVLRHWRPGDRFQPIGLPTATKLQNWFTNRKVPAARRRVLILAETEQGVLFWVEGERIGEVGKVTPETRRVLELQWQRA